jgi:hypothetical protein
MAPAPKRLGANDFSRANQPAATLRTTGAVECDSGSIGFMETAWARMPEKARASRGFNAQRPMCGRSGRMLKEKGRPRPKVNIQVLGMQRLASNPPLNTECQARAEGQW